MFGTHSKIKYVLVKVYQFFMICSSEYKFNNDFFFIHARGMFICFLEIYISFKLKLNGLCGSLPVKCVLPGCVKAELGCAQGSPRNTIASVVQTTKGTLKFDYCIYNIMSVYRATILYRNKIIDLLTIENI